MKNNEIYTVLSNPYPLDREIRIPYFKHSPFDSDIEDESETIIVDNIETAFQAIKCKHLEDFLKFNKLSSKEAIELGKTVEIRDRWEKDRDMFMMILIIIKKHNCEIFKYILANLKPEDYLIYYNEDTYWGFNPETKEGKNRMGELLMRAGHELREQIRIFEEI